MTVFVATNLTLSGYLVGQKIARAFERYISDSEDRIPQSLPTGLHSHECLKFLSAIAPGSSSCVQFGVIEISIPNVRCDVQCYGRIWSSIPLGSSDRYYRSGLRGIRAAVLGVFRDRSVLSRIARNSYRRVEPSEAQARKKVRKSMSWPLVQARLPLLQRNPLSPYHRK